MNTKSQYKTRQHDDLLRYLRTVPGQHITAADICEHFRCCGKPIGTATVYRQLEKMVSAGLVTKYNIDAGSPACFEFVGDRHTQSEERCYHCKCEQCGKLIHMHCEELPELERHIREHHGFSIDPMRTVFFGLCAECANANAG